MLCPSLIVLLESPKYSATAVASATPTFLIFSVSCIKYASDELVTKLCSAIIVGIPDLIPSSITV